MDTHTSLATARAHTSRADLFSVVAAGLFWGTGGLAGALLAAGPGLHPVAVAASRLIVGGALLVLGLVVTGRARLLRVGEAARRRVVVLGVLTATYQSCYFAAVALTSVSSATLVAIGAAPMLVVAAETVRTRRRPQRRVMAALGLAVTGLGLLVGAPGTEVSSAAQGAGTALALGAAAGFAAITMLGSRPVDGLDVLPVTGMAFLAGGSLLVPVVLVAGGPGVVAAFDAGLATLGLVAFLGLVPTALAYGLYFTGLRSVAPASAALIALLEPLTAAGLAAVFLGDRLGPSGLAGAVLICCAVVLCGRSRPARAANGLDTIAG